MKTIFLSAMLLLAASTLHAQEVTVYRLQNTTSYPGLSVPASIRASFEAAYPDVVVQTWDPVNNYWRATYKLDNRVMYVFYDERGVNYRAALPVVQNNVSESVITAALNTYGPVVYGITKMKGANNTEVYQLRLLENGTTRIAWMDAAGTTVTDVFKVKTDDPMVTPKSEQ